MDEGVGSREYGVGSREYGVGVDDLPAEFKEAGADDLTSEIEVAPHYAEIEGVEGAEELPYTMGSWNGMDQWRCRYCPWDTLAGEEAMLAHYRGTHAPKPPRKRVVRLPLVDRFGNVIEREVTDGED